MALGDGIRRNIGSVDPTERALLRDALIELNRRFFPGNRTDPVPGGVSWWFKQDEIHQATHVHRGPEFLPWHREIVNRLEEMLRQINPQLSLHYWDWTQDPRSIANANLGGGLTGTLNLFTLDFMGFGGATSNTIGEPWLSARYYVPTATPHRDGSGNPADPPRTVNRSVSGSPVTLAIDTGILNAGDYAVMRGLLENAHDAMHGFVNMGGPHISFRDPFVFLLHSNVDRLFASWQTDPAHPERLDPTTVYGSESNLDVLVAGHIQNVNHNIEPWSGGTNTRPWAAPENQQVPKNYKHPSVVAPPRYDTNVRPPAWNGPADLTTVNNIVSVAGHFATGDQRHLVVIGTAHGNVHDIFWQPGQVGIEGEEDVPVDFGAGTIVSVATLYHSDDQRHVVLVGKTDGQVHVIFWKADTVGIEGHDVIPVTFAPGSIVAVSGLYNNSDQRHVVVVGTTEGKLHEIFWKSDTVGIEGHSDFPVSFESGSIVAVSGFYDSRTQRHVVAVGTRDGRVHQIYWKADTVGIEAHGMVTQFSANSIVSLAGFYSASDQIEHIVVGLANGRLCELWVKPDLTA